MPKKQIETSADSIIRFTQKVGIWLLEHRLKMLIGIFAGFVIWGGFVVKKKMDEKKLQAFYDDLYEAENAKEPVKEIGRLVEEKSGLKANLWARLSLIHKLKEKKDFESALTEIEAALKVAPEEFKSLLLLSKSEILRQQKKINESLKTIDEIFNLKKAILESYAQLVKASLLEEKGDISKASEIYENLLEDQNQFIKERAQSRLVLLSIKNQQ